MSTARSPDYCREDGQILTTAAKGSEPHPEYRLRSRADPPFDDRSVRSLWQEAEPAGWLDAHSYVRYHRASGLALIARWKIIRTVVEPRGGAIEHHLRQQGVLGGGE